jgi:hypothetical protein
MAVKQACELEASERTGMALTPSVDLACPLGWHEPMRYG